MIHNFVKISLENETRGKVSISDETRNSLILRYPCDNGHVCTPYVVDVSKGVYKIECWGSIGANWNQKSRPGLGAYTSGTLYIPKPLKLFVYIGNTGFFNAVKEMESDVYGTYPGGATDVRLNSSLHWWDNYSLKSRIMVAAGGGGAEWAASIGGNGGEYEGGSSASATSADGTETHPDLCQGAKQTDGSNCVSFDGMYGSKYYVYNASKGTFGSAGQIEPINGRDYGGFGGGGYYGGTSYQVSYAGNGGSSFISGLKGCKAVKDQLPTISHDDDSVHYSGIVFNHPKMIQGNKTMPLPKYPLSEGLHSGEGAFRITLVLYNFQCTHKKNLFFNGIIYGTFVLFWK